MQCKNFMQVSKGRLRAALLLCYSEAYAGQKSHGRCENLVVEEDISVLVNDS